MKMKPKLNIEERGSRIILLLVAAAFLINTTFLVVTTQFRFSGYTRYLNSFEAGSIAERDLIADRSLTYVDEQETEALIDERLDKVLPVFSIEVDRIYKSLTLFDQFASFIQNSPDSMSAESIAREMELRFSLGMEEELAVLLEEGGNLERVLPIVESVLRSTLENGVIGDIPPKAMRMAEHIRMRKWENGERIDVSIPKDRLPSIERLGETIHREFRQFPLSEKERTIAAGIAKMFLSPTAFYDGPLTEARRQEVRDDISPILRKIEEGELLIRSGDLVSEEDMERIDALRSARPKPNSKESLAILLYTSFIFILGFILLGPLLRHTKRRVQYTVILLAASVFFFANTFITARIAFIPENFPLSLGILTAFLSMMISIFMTERIGIIASLLFSLGLFAIPSMDIYAFLFSFFAGVTGIYAMENAEKRIDLVTGTMKLTGVLIVLLLVIGLLQQEDITWMVRAGGMGILYSLVSGGLTLALLPALEHILNAPTVFRLRELSDTNTPVFRRMITAAPGTYSHSMSVANLAESACREIGADHLLARVGAYYHDIGKMEQPDYFIENQQDRNRHDEITPNLSVAVIKSHVKLGKEKAKELKLPPEVVEIVADHHGNDVIGYFYSQALKQSDQKISPEEFSYNGSPPKSKEAAIVMLADVIEAQSRTLKKPTVKKFEKMVWEAIMRKITNGQLSRSDLSFQDIELINNAFVQILAGHFHNRIEYPDTKETEE